MRRNIATVCAATLLLAAASAVLADPPSPRPGDAITRRTRTVTVDAPQLAAAVPGELVRMQIFDDAAFGLRVDRVERREGGVTLHGKVDGDVLGTFVITIDGANVSAGIWTSRGAFGLAPSATPGVCEAREIRPDAMTRCAMGKEHSAAGPAHVPAAPADGVLPGDPGGMHPRGGDPTPRGDGCDRADDQATLDVLVVYTALARDAAGGAAALQTRAQNAIDSMNAAMVNSAIHTGGANRLQVNLAGFLEIAYDEQAPEWINHLERVTETDDGFMDGVHAMRDAHHADTVCLIINDDRFTGGAGWWAHLNQALAFTCINWRSVGAGDLLLAHELGHNFGCAHDYENDPTAPFFFGRGHYFTHMGTTYGTIMSYPGDVHIPYYSNPLLSPPPAGLPAGAPLSDPRAAWNARVISHTRWALTSYRDSGRIIDCNGNGVDDAADIASGTSADANGDCRPDECETRLYVDASAPAEGSGVSWNDPIKDLPYAMELASLHGSNVSEIWVADGVYKPSRGTDRFASFHLRSGLALYGGFQGQSRPGGGETSLAQRQLGMFQSVLSGDIGQPGLNTDNSFTVVGGDNAGSNAVLDGFVIRDGYSDFSGAGLYAASSSIRVRNCVFTGNACGYGGGALLGGAGSPVLENCTFDSNIAANGGGGLWLSDGVNITIDRCRFESNAGRWGGAIAGNDSSINVRSCVFIENQAVEFNGGAIDVNNCALTLTNSIFADNTAAMDAGAAWTANGTTATATNCTFYGNHAGGTTGGLVAYFDAAQIVNSVFWGNTGSGSTAEQRQLVYFGATGGVRYSRVQGWTGGLGGAGNSGADPLLADPDDGDFALRAGSPCIDAGDTPAIPAGVTMDALGNPRRVDDPATADSGVGPAPVVDIGGVEFQPGPSCPGDFNEDGGVNSQDFFDFLGAFFSFNPSADFNHDGSINSQDFFDFLGAFFAGC